MLRKFVKARLSPSLRHAIRQSMLEWRIQRMHASSVRRAAQLLDDAPVRLNLACGYRPKPGWINVDLFTPHADLRLDLRRPFPFPSQSVSRIYTEHYFEHLSYPNLADSAGWALEADGRPSEALSFLRECRRVLLPGGVLDVVVPDAESIVCEYANRARAGFPAYPWWGPEWCDTAMHCVNYVFRQGREHQYAYDYETLSRVLQSTGFHDIARRPFDPAMDAPNHEIGSLAVVAT